MVELKQETQHCIMSPYAGQVIAIQEKLL